MNGKIVWTQGQSAIPRITVGDVVTLSGANFGQGTEGDFSKILVGNVRALERDLPMFEGGVHLLKQLFFETSKVTDSWRKDIQTWSRTEIVFRMPRTASRGPIVFAIQERVGAVESAHQPGMPHLVVDPLTARAEGVTATRTPISRLGTAIESNAVPVEIDNPAFEEDIRAGEAAFLGLRLQSRARALASRFGLAHDPSWKNERSHHGRAGRSPKTLRRVAGPPGRSARRGTGSIRVRPLSHSDAVEAAARKPMLAGKTSPTGWVGYVYAQGISVVSQREGNWIGFNCASCHAQRIVFEEKPGSMRAKVFPGPSQYALVDEMEHARPDEGREDRQGRRCPRQDADPLRRSRGHRRVHSRARSERRKRVRR